MNNCISLINNYNIITSIYFNRASEMILSILFEKNYLINHDFYGSYNIYKEYSYRLFFIFECTCRNLVNVIFPVLVPI